LSRNIIKDDIDLDKIDFRSIEEISIDLSFNKIKRFLSRNWHQIPSQKLHINLDGNNFICDCWITELKQKLDGSLATVYNDLFSLSSDKIICNQKSNQSTTGKLLQDVKYEELLCPFPSTSFRYNCTTNCSCFLDRYNRHTVMDCANRNMTKFPESLVLIPKESDSIQLHLENNLLDTLMGGLEKTQYQNISGLYLSNNKIEEVEINMLPKELEMLTLDHNYIKTVNETKLEYFSKMIQKQQMKLKIGNNPFYCSCKNRDLFHFLKNAENYILDAQNVSLKCEMKELNLLAARLHEFCETSISAILIAIVCAIIFLLIVICIVLSFYSCHSDTIKIWIYSKSWARIFFTEDLIDKDKPYDAFLSYSHADADFVEKVLLQGLENAKNPDHRYKCLIHTRDWNIGEMIPHQIIQSVESSRRTIIVLSKSYLEAMWTKLEFRAAHTQAIQDKRQRVILIVVGQLPTDDNIDANLKKYISLNTYLDSEDPWFWQKLRYAMPHRGTSWKKKRSRRVTDKIELIRSMASVEMGRSCPPSPKSAVQPSTILESLTNDNLLLKEPGALIRNNPHLKKPLDISKFEED